MKGLVLDFRHFHRFIIFGFVRDNFTVKFKDLNLPQTCNNTELSLSLTLAR